MLKQKLKILGPHPVAIEEVDTVFKEKEVETRKFLATEEKNHKYLTQIEYLSGRLHGLTIKAIPSATERFAAGVEA